MANILLRKEMTAKMPAIQSKFYICVELGDVVVKRFIWRSNPPAIEKIEYLISPPSYLRINYTLTGNEIAVLEVHPWIHQQVMIVTSRQL